jgi:outer membrane protein OmpA-like peptidoglycan-associated protein
MRFTRNFKPALMVVAALTVAGASGCASMSRTGNGALIGGTAGGVAGAVIGNATGSTARGAIIGAVIGGAAGAAIGHRMDARARELGIAIPGATVERVGEGIQVTFPSGLLFDFDSDVVRPDAAAKLNTLSASLVKYDDSSVMIAGHTDNVGTSEYNQKLSERRAESAARYMVGQGVQRHIATAGLGERETISSNETDAGRQRNRRIEIAIYASQATQEAARREVAGR